MHKPFELMQTYLNNKGIKAKCVSCTTRLSTTNYNKHFILDDYAIIFQHQNTTMNPRTIETLVVPRTQPPFTVTIRGDLTVEWDGFNVKRHSN